MKGTVKWFDEAKGYGFIACEDKKEVFVHYSKIVVDGFKTLKEGQKVSFEIKKNALNGKSQAVNVVIE